MPDQGPDIIGGQPRYNIGDRVNVTCVSHNSMPAAQLAWYINGEKADPIHIREYNPTKRNGLLTSSLGLSFKVYSFLKFKLHCVNIPENVCCAVLERIYTFRSAISIFKGVT